MRSPLILSEFKLSSADGIAATGGRVSYDHFSKENPWWCQGFYVLSISKIIGFMESLLREFAVHQPMVKLSRAALMALQQLVREHHMITTRKENLGYATAFLC